jgi:hypothetical protein
MRYVAIIGVSAALLAGAFLWRSSRAPSSKRSTRAPSPSAGAPSATMGESAAPAAARRDAAAEARHYRSLPDEEFREEVFGAADDVRIGRESKNDSAVADAMLRLQSMGDRAVPHLLEVLGLAKNDADRASALVALQAFGPVKDAEALARALGALPEGAPSRMIGASMLLGTQDEAARGYLQSVQSEARSAIDRAEAPLETRSLSVRVYGAVQGRSAEPLLVEIAAAADRPVPMRYAALATLAQNGVSTDAARRLEPVAQSAPSMLRAMAANLAGAKRHP